MIAAAIIIETKLPNGDQAIVEDRKLQDYVLNPLHPVGKHHAALFAALLGIDTRNADRLKQALLDAAQTADVDDEVMTEYGRKYTIRFTMAGPSGNKTVLAVWILEIDEAKPRLVTCYVE